MKTTTRGKPIVTKAGLVRGLIKVDDLNRTGLTSRIRGHVSARGRRLQRARDIRNAVPRN